MAETIEEREWKLLGKQRIAATMKANWLARKRETEALRLENAAKRQRCIAAKLDMAERIEFWENLNADSKTCLPTSHEHFWDNLDSDCNRRSATMGVSCMCFSISRQV